MTNEEKNINKINYRYLLFHGTTVKHDHYKTEVFKGSTTRDFRLQVFLRISVPQAPKYSIGAVLNFFEIRGYIRE
jgi:hypothetical protein